MINKVRLLRPSTWVREQIEERIQLGHGLIAMARQATNEAALDDCRYDYYSWTEFNTALLETSFDGPIAQENSSIAAFGVAWGPPPLREQIADLVRDIREDIRRLDSIRGRIDLYEGSGRELPVADAAEAQSGPETPAASSAHKRLDAVFLVHGRAEAPKHEVARWLGDVGLDPVILHEQPNGGRTIIEKFGEEAGGVGYAVVLATGDDEGRKKGKTQLKPRPRQNVVLELGFFLGQLGRDRVAVLREPEIELPSDYDGVVYIDLDSSGGWKLGLARELESAGLRIDRNKLTTA